MWAIRQCLEDVVPWYKKQNGSLGIHNLIFGNVINSVRFLMKFSDRNFLDRSTFVYGIGTMHTYQNFHNGIVAIEVCVNPSARNLSI